MEGSLAEILAWLEPRALLFALALPPVIRLVGHFLPEEVFMVSMGVLAARSGSPYEAVLLLGAVIVGHFVTDQTVYLLGRWLRPRLGRYPRIRRRLDSVTERIESSPLALIWFIPARVFPFARGAWLAGCGVVGVTWRRFIVVDLTALSVHLMTWSGLGWWFSGNISHIESTAVIAKLVAVWIVFILTSTTLGWFLWRHKHAWKPATVRAVRAVGRTLFPFGRSTGQ